MITTPRTALDLQEIAVIDGKMTTKISARKKVGTDFLNYHAYFLPSSFSYITSGKDRRQISTTVLGRDTPALSSTTPSGATSFCPT